MANGDNLRDVPEVSEKVQPATFDASQLQVGADTKVNMGGDALKSAESFDFNSHPVNGIDNAGNAQKTEEGEKGNAVAPGSGEALNSAQSSESSTAEKASEAAASGEQTTLSEPGDNKSKTDEKQNNGAETSAENGDAEQHNKHDMENLSSEEEPEVPPESNADPNQTNENNGNTTNDVEEKHNGLSENNSGTASAESPIIPGNDTGAGAAISTDGDTHGNVGAVTGAGADNSSNVNSEGGLSTTSDGSASEAANNPDMTNANGGNISSGMPPLTGGAPVGGGGGIGRPVW